MNDTTFLSALSETIRQLEIQTIDESRKRALMPLIEYIRKKRANGEKLTLAFICTHNSRRSQLSQVWATVAADLYSVELSTCSGGTEATEFNKRAVQALRTDGFRIEEGGDGNKPYKIWHKQNGMPLIAYSKVIDDMHAENFGAIMTCSDADENCPYITGAEIRIPVRYEDPKIFDNTAEEERMYLERSRQIGAEMLFVFRSLNT